MTDLWYADWHNVINLAEWLWNRGDFLSGGHDDEADERATGLFYMLKKPWKYSAEWEAYERQEVTSASS